MSPSKIGHTTLGRADACQYKLPEHDDYRCPHPRLTKAHKLCIFHNPKTAEKTDDKFTESLLEWISHPVGGTANFIDMRGFEFPVFRFNPSVLPKTADFGYAVFNGEILFNVGVPKLKIEHEYDDTHESSLLRHGASFEHAHFKAKATFNGCSVEGQLSFESAVFDKDIGFANIHVTEGCNFSNAVFNAEVDFSFANLHDVRFSRVQFLGTTNFQNLIVQESAGFDNAEFHKPVEFFRCHFGSTYDLSDPLDANPADPPCEAGQARVAETYFNWAVFHDTVTFYETFFYAEAEFAGATFRKRALFYGHRSNLFTEGASFSNVKLPKDEELIFEQVDLSKTGFHDTYLDKILFRDVRWGRPTGRIRRFLRGNSFVLWDEIRPLRGMRDDLDDAKTADNYRQLVINYETKRDYETAEAFHVSEMEMRRKGHGYTGTAGFEELSETQVLFLNKLKLYVLSNFWTELRTYLNGYSLYWISSRYGTSYGHAVIVLALLLFGFSILFLYAGLAPTPENKLEDARIIEYNFLPDESHPPASAPQAVRDWRESFFYTLEIATFQKEKLYQPISWEGRALVYTTVILLAGQAALLLLSIRRRFRRE